MGKECGYVIEIPIQQSSNKRQSLLERKNKNATNNSHSLNRIRPRKKRRNSKKDAKNSSKHFRFNLVLCLARPRACISLKKL